MVRTLAAREPNLVGIKVSDRSLDELRAYMLPSLDVFVGSEALIPEGLALGAVGAVSGLAAAMPEAVVRVLAGQESADHVTFLRKGLAAYPLQAALKTALIAQGVLEQACVRGPLRGLTDAERASCLAWLAEVGLAGEPAAGARLASRGPRAAVGARGGAPGGGWRPPGRRTAPAAPRMASAGGHQRPYCPTPRPMWGQVSDSETQSPTSPRRQFRFGK